MATAKYKIRDAVKIVNNSLQPQWQGKIGIVKKVYATWSEDASDNRQFLYRITVDNIPLKGMACESDLQPA